MINIILKFKGTLYGGIINNDSSIPLTQEKFLFQLYAYFYHLRNTPLTNEHFKNDLLNLQNIHKGHRIQIYLLEKSS